MNVIVVDDEIQAAETLSLMLEKYCLGVNVVGVFHGLEDLVAADVAQNLDIVFLDINFGEYTGFDVLDRVDFSGADIVFVTAYDNFGIQAIKEGAFDYIVKPIDPEELVNSVNRLHKKKNKLTRVQQNQDVKDTILVQVKNAYVKVRLADIEYIEADGAYSTIYCDDERYVSSKRIGWFETALPTNKFIRTHNSYLVNLEHVKMLKVGRDQPLVLSSGKEIPVARNKRKSVMDALSLI